MPSLEIRPLEPATWAHLERLFATKSAYGGCWCMFFRQTSGEFERKQGAPNRRALKALVDAGEPTGLLAYAGDEPVGWASVAPRAAYERLRRSPLLVGAHDEPGIWSLLCLYVAPDARRGGVTHTLVEAACEHARRQGAEVLETLPRASGRGRSAAELYVGTRRLFAAHGFEAVRGKRSSGGRLVMRRKLRSGAG